MRTKLSLAFIFVLISLFSACFVQRPNFDGATRITYYHGDIAVAFPRDYKIIITNSQAELIMDKRSGEHKLTAEITEEQFKEALKTIAFSGLGRLEKSPEDEEIADGCCRTEIIEIFAGEKLVYSMKSGQIMYGDWEAVKNKLKSFFPPDFERSFDEYPMRQNTHE